MKPTTFVSHLVWSGAAKEPTRNPVTFSRDLDVSFGTHAVPMSSAPEFRGDPTRVNPEQLFVASIAACHALTYLFLAARHGVTVVAYRDDAEGTLEVIDGRLRMSRVTLRPHITLEAGASESAALELVPKAHEGCFIANSISTVVQVEPTVELLVSAE